MTEYRFKKGEKVPSWLESVTPAALQDRLVFQCDCLVERGGDYYRIFPEAEMQEGEYLVHFDNKDITGTTITGAPTWMYKYPKGDPRNDAGKIDFNMPVGLAPVLDTTKREER